MNWEGHERRESDLQKAFDQIHAFLELENYEPSQDPIDVAEEEVQPPRM